MVKSWKAFVTLFTMFLSHSFLFMTKLTEMFFTLTILEVFIKIFEIFAFK